MRDYKKYFIFFQVIISLFVLLRAEEIQVSTSVNNKSITERDLLKYTVKVEGDKDANIAQPKFKNFRIKRGPSRSSRFQVINGDVSTTKTVTWWLEPVQSGKLVLPSIKVKTEKGLKETEKIQIKVVSSSDAQKNKKQSSQTRSGQAKEKTPEVFFKAEPEKHVIYEGEQLNVNFVLYFQKKVQNFARGSLPQGTNFWTEEFDPPRRPNVTQVKYKGEEYNQAILQEIAFFPTTSGTLTIDPMKMKVEVISQNRGSQNRGNSFFNSSFFSETQVKSLSSDSLDIKVKPLPTPTPSNFSGGVGDYTIEADIDTPRIKQNEAFTLKYRVEGQGNINSVSLSEPEITFSAEIFDPEVDRASKKRGKTIVGNATYEYVVIPHEPGKFTIPPLKFVYFDTEQDRYITRNTSKFDIQVTESISKGDTGRKDRVNNSATTDIRYIKSQAQHWQKLEQEFYDYWWFWALNIMAVLIFGATLIYQYNQDKIQQGVAVFKKTKAFKTAQEIINQAEEELQKNNYEEVINNIAQSIKIYILNRLGLDSRISGIGEIKKILAKEEIEDDFILKIEQLYQKIEQMKYAPESKSEEEYNNLIQETRNILESLKERLE